MTRKQAILYILFSAIGLNLVVKKYFWDVKGINFFDFKMIISELAEVIIPSTDTPGAKDAGVANYIINVMTNCATRYEKISFINGLERIKRFRTPTGESFLSADEDEKKKYVEDLERASAFFPPAIKRFRSKVLGASFYDQFKWLTVSGYFCSEIGATKALAYDAVPGRFLSCIALSEDQRSWATK